MKVIGITGNIGSGKTRIAHLFYKNGCAVIELDKLGHHLLEQQPYKKKILQTFGKYVFDDNNNIRRSKLRKIVFSNPDLLEKLNMMIHPALIKELIRQLDLLKKKKNVKAIVVDAALLFEMKIEKLFDFIITVYTNKLLSYWRLWKRRKINFFEFLNIYSSQNDPKDKRQRSDMVIYNHLGWKFNRRKLEKIVKSILASLK